MTLEELKRSAIMTQKNNLDKKEQIQFLDAAFEISDMIQKTLLDHPSYRHLPETVRCDIEKTANALGRTYQAIGALET